MTAPSIELLVTCQIIAVARATVARIGTDEMPMPPDINDHCRHILGRVIGELERLNRLLAVNVAEIERRHASPEHED